MTPAPRAPYVARVPRRPTADRVDLLLAPLFVVAYELQVALVHGLEHRPLAGIAGAVVCGGLALRRRFPLAVGLLTQAMMTATYPVLDLPAGPVTVAWFSALYALAVWTPSRQFAAAVPVVLLANGGTDLWQDPTSTSATFGVVTAVVMVLVRVAVGGRDRQLRLAEREREVAAREAVVGERERIARELHDVIGHHVSTMVVQAGAERRMLPPGQDGTREVLGTIERVGRGALDEMRRMVAMLRQDPRADLVPQPTLDDLPVLVETMRANGLPVELRVDGEVRELPAGIELSAYRIVQEALTNVVKHAGGAPARIVLSYGADSLEITVRDEGSGPARPGLGGGHGLVGMRERVAMYGGRLEAGPARSGGYAVRVELPVR
jgi:signal transduction histidine kinase